MYQIFVVEDELLIRQSICKVIEGMAGPYVLCGEASDGELALSMMQDLMPDIVLTDIRMPFLDGFELIRHVKDMMPWLKVAIISGYGDFEYAQRAITLGVDHYLLKPIRPAELVEVIEDMARRIDQDRQKRTLPGGYDTDEVQQALRQHFMQQLLYGGLHTSTLLEKARSLRLDVLKPLYQPVLFSFGAPVDHALLQISVRNLMERMELPLYCFSESNVLTVLLDGQDAQSLTERVYQFNAILRHEVQEVSPVITTVVGSIVQRLSAVGQAYHTASDLLKKVFGVSLGQVVDVNDAAQIVAEMIELGDPFGPAFQQKLQRVGMGEVEALVDEVLRSPEGSRFGSTLMRYYALVDLLKMTVQQVVKAGEDAGPDVKDVASRLSGEYDLLAASGTAEGFRDTAIDLIRRFVSLRREPRAQEETLGAMKYSHVISRAEKYVAENFCDPNISLISVARYVGLSAAHFSTIFSQSVGRSFISYLTAMRINRAKELLANTSMKLSAIAMEIGYNEPNYFSHVFRKSEGVTPKEYRNRTAAADRGV
ncbi:MAG: response regulator [Clostridia bacterium]|nr:response regulator [Clostridia bacterium]